MKRLILSWVITLFLLLSPSLSQTSQAQCPGATTTFSHGNTNGGFDLTYESAQIVNNFYVRLTFKVVNYYKSAGMDYLACEMPGGAGVVSSGVSIKSPFSRLYEVNNGTSITNKNLPTFYGAKMVSIDEKSQFKSGANLENNDTYSLDMSLYEFTRLNTLHVAVRAGGDGGGAGNEKVCVVPIDVSGCKAALMGSVANFNPKMISGPVEPMSGDTVQYTISQENGFSYKWGVPDINDGDNNPPNWKIIDGQYTNTVRVKVGMAGGSMRVEVTDPDLGTNARTLAVAVVPDPLPVELTNFTGIARDGAVELNWFTASEVDNDRFEVERSTNGKDFVKIAEVKGAGNSSVLLEYSFKDMKAPGGAVYYRLNQIDYSKDHEYSKVISVRNNQTGKGNSLRVHPNPVTEGSFTVVYETDSANDQPVTLKLTEMSGKTILTQTHEAGAGEANLMLHHLGLRKGMYILSLESGKDLQIQRILVH